VRQLAASALTTTVKSTSAVYTSAVSMSTVIATPKAAFPKGAVMIKSGNLPIAISAAIPAPKDPCPA
jgi:hypothetical protein